ncbi:MAG: LLM class F420-dependent oxidoreductase [Acidobacteria bacterium]|nr:MAG: LLM class F420-dependent oxidoreductase [Acidobacteriota bacterium]
MDFGVHIGARHAADNPDGIRTIARHCEGLGYAYFGVSDHIIIPRQVDSHYPYNEAGIWPGTGKGTCLEQLTTLTFVAAITERIRLLPSVMVLPYRPPVQTAKILASLDVLSKGRLTIGVGTGWNAEEMIALGSPPFDRRGTASDQYLAAFRTLWTSDTPTYAGEFVSFDNLIFEPKPVQDPHPPIWIGGEGRVARRRAGRFGDGWYPVGRNPRISLETPELFSEGLAEVHRFAEASGRDPSIIDTAMAIPWYRLGEAGKDTDGSRRRFTGSAEQIAEDARGLRDAGLKHLIIAAEYTELQQSLDEMERFAKEVVPLIN